MIVEFEVKVPPGILGMADAIASALPQIANALQNDIKSAAQRELTSSLLEYQRGVDLKEYVIRPKSMKSGSKTFAVVSLNGWLANAVEEGWAGGNMVGWLVGGRSGRTGIRGKYATIRFRHTKAGTSGMVGTVMGQPEHKMGGMGKQQAELVGRRISRAAERTLTANASAPKTSKQTARLSAQTTSKMGALTMRGSAKGSRRHTTSVYTGMTKRKDSAGTSYETFRRASTNVSGKWIHPGIKPHNFFAFGLRRLPKHANQAINAAIEGLKR